MNGIKKINIGIIVGVNIRIRVWAWVRLPIRVWGDFPGLGVPSCGGVTPRGLGVGFPIEGGGSYCL